MKFNTIYLGLALAATAFSSCAELDTEPWDSVITEQQKQNTYAQNPERINAVGSSLSSLMKVYNGSNDKAHSDFGYASLMLLLDTRGTDMVTPVAGYNHYRAQVQMTDNSSESASTLYFWNTLYRQIYAANRYASTMDSAATDPVLQFSRAQALAFRAFDYFTLAQLHQLTYVGNEDKACVPLITDKNAAEASSSGAPRATVRAVYAQILSDINEAIDLFEKSGHPRDDKRYFNAAVAKGLRARIHLVMNNWQAAATDAQAAIDAAAADGIVPASRSLVSAPGFIESDSKKTPNWMWCLPFTESDDAVKTVICNFPSMMGSFSYGYASAAGVWHRISKSLFNAIPSTDVRKGWFLDASRASANLSDDQKAFAARRMPAYTQVKFAPAGEIGEQAGAHDVPLMRIEEMYLILAEAQAMGGNPTQGATTLANFVTTYRDPSYTITAGTATDVQDAVWMQRRIELWGEGFSYFDLLRLKKGIDRRGAGFAVTGVFNIAANDYLTVFPIPNDEIQANKALSASDNNPTTTAPTPVTDLP